MGAAVVPIVEAGTAVYGAISASNQQKAAAAAANAAYGNESSNLAQSDELARQLAQGPAFQDLLDAEGTGVRTLMSTIGGVANPGALIQELFGTNVQNALTSSIKNRSANLEGAINALQGSGNQYGAMARGASSGAPAGNPWANAAGSIFGLLNKRGTPTGMAPGGSDVAPGDVGAGPSTTGGYSGDGPY